MIFFYRRLCLCLVFCLVLSPVSLSSPKRVVSLDMCTDWMLIKFAASEQILALSDYVYRYPVDWVGSDWATHDGSLEQLLALKPDLVLVGEYNARLLRQRLIDLGVSVSVLSLPRTLHEVKKYEYEFVSLLGRPEYLVDTMPDRYEHSGRAGRMLLLGANGIGTGRGTLENDVLEYAGWDNYLDQEGYISLDLEKLVIDPPDVVLWSAPRSAALANQFAEHPVLKRLLSDERWLHSDYWHWQCPGPWTWQLIEKMRP